MKLNSNQSAQLLSRLPPFELSYEMISHKKVLLNYEVCLAIPQSKKFYAWFSFQRGQDVCYLMELTREKKIGLVTIAQTLFHPSLSLGTLLYGSLIECGQNKYQFVIEDMFYYKGISIQSTMFSHKLGFIYEFLKKSIVQRFQENEPDTIYNIIFTLPVMWGINSQSFDPEVVPESINAKITYPIHHLQYRSLHTICPFLNYFPNKKPNLKMDVIAIVTDDFVIDTTKRFISDFHKPQYNYKTVFKVCADLQNDIYHLYAYGKNCDLIYYDYAYIPNYNTSVFMNGLFRNIKENVNLDYIEESEDEADFQDMRYDKYVDLSKKLCIECVFNKKFKRWTPLRVITDSLVKVIHISKLVKNFVF